MKVFQQLLIAPAALGLLVPLAVKADGMDHSAMDHGEHGARTMLMGKTTFVVGGVDGVSGKGAVTFNYDTKLMAHTSFNGEDLLKMVVRSGNFNNMDPFGMMGDARIDTAFNSGDALNLHRAYYQFPLGENFKATLGAKLRQDDMLAVWPSAYPDDSILKSFTYAGANAVYSKKMGAGAGLSYDTGNGWSGSLVYVGSEGDDAENGLFTDESADDITSQIAYVAEQFGAALAYTTSDSASGDYESWGVSAYWNPAESGMLPSVSLGVGFEDPETGDDENTWTLGVQWSDVFADGNTLGLGIGTATAWDEDSDGPMAYEAWYQIGVSDNITVTPAVFVVEREDDDDVTGAIVKTTFRF